MKDKYKYIMLMFFVIIPSNIKALCTNSENVRLKSIASNINVIYEPIEENNNVTFNVTLTNLTNEISIRDLTNKKDYVQNGELSINGYSYGKTYKFRVYANTNNCNGAIDMIYVTLPSYNPYYNDNACSDIKEYKLCQKWTTMNLNYDEFINKINKYKESKKSTKPITKKDDRGLFDIIIDFVINYYYIVLGIIVIIGTIIIIIRKRKYSLFR